LAADLSEDEKDRRRIEELFDSTFGALHAIAEELGFDVTIEADGTVRAAKREHSSSARGSARREKVPTVSQRR